MSIDRELAEGVVVLELVRRAASFVWNLVSFGTRTPVDQVSAGMELRSRAKISGTSAKPGPRSWGKRQRTGTKNIMSRVNHL